MRALTLVTLLQHWIAPVLQSPAGMVAVDDGGVTEMVLLGAGVVDLSVVAVTVGVGVGLSVVDLSVVVGSPPRLS